MESKLLETLTEVNFKRYLQATKVLKSMIQEKVDFETLIRVDPRFICPITKKLIKEPVT